MKEKKKLRKSLIAIILVVCCGVCLAIGTASMKVSAAAAEEASVVVSSETGTGEKGYVITDQNGEILETFDENGNVTGEDAESGIMTLDSYYEYSKDGVTWTWETVDGVRTWTSCSGYGSDLVVPNYDPEETTLNDYVSNPVVAIGKKLFYKDKTIETVFVPTGYIRTIGDSAFYNCGNLKSVEIGDSVTTIGPYAFYSCNYIKTLSIGKDVANIYVTSFNDIYYLSELYFNATSMNDVISDNYLYCSFSYAGRYSKAVAVYIGANVRRIPANLFDSYGTTSGHEARVTSVEFKTASVCSEIGSYAFRSCIYLESIIIPSSVTLIGASAFYKCSKLTSVTFEKTEVWTVTYTSSVTGTTTLTLEENDLVANASTYLVSTYYTYVWTRVDSLDLLIYTLSSEGTYYILSGCTGTFTSVVIDSTYENLPVKEIDSNVFDGHSEITSVTIPENITTIGSFAFRNCTSLTSVKIPDSVTYIGSNAFRGCTALASVTMGSGVETIMDSSFRSCSKLTSITIPESVTFISDWAFYDCTGLTEIHFNAVNCGDFATNVNPFEGVGKSGTTLTLYIGANVTRIPAYMLYCPSGPKSNVSVVKFEGVSKCAEAGTNAFVDCSALTKLYVEDLASFLAIDFADKYANPLFVVSENKGTFYVNNSSTTKLTTANTASATRLGSYSLAYCTILTSVELGDKVTYIGDHAFDGMTSLTTLSLSTYTGWEIYDADGNYVQRISMMNLTEYALKYLTSNYVEYTWILSSDSVGGPVITSNIESGYSTNCSFTITVTCDADVGFAYINCVCPDGTVKMYSSASFTFSFTSGGADDGKYEFVAYDGDGNNSATYIIYVDTVAPEIWVNGSIVWKNYDGDSFTVKAEDDIDPEPMLMYSRDGGETWTSYGTNECTITADSDMHSTDGYWYFMAIDAAGNPSKTYQTILDTVEVFGEWGYYDDETHYMYFSYEAPYYSDWTCTIDGEEYVSGTELTECQKTYVITLTSANGSSHTYEKKLDHYYADEGVTVAPTCVEMGYTVQTCSYCGEEYYSNWLEACGHSYREIYVKEATCTTNELTYIYCTDCHDVMSITSTGDALGHNWVADYVETEATCTAAGVQHYSCSRDGCSEEKTEAIAALNHIYVGTITKQTCTADGYTTYTCSRCNDSYIDDWTSATGHTTKTETTTTCAGSTDHTYCTNEGCDYEYYNYYDSDTYVAHDWSDWTTVSTADCYTDGSMTRKCYICGMVETQVTKAYDHTTETSVYKYDALSVPADGVTVTSSGVTYYVYAGYLTDVNGNRYIYNTKTKQTYTTASNPYITTDSKGNQVDTEEDNEDTIIVYYCSLENGYVCYLASSFMADSVESTGNKLIDLFQKYSKYLWWILLALVVIWSLFIGLRWVLARNDQEKAKSHSMLANYLLGIFVIAIIIVGCPYAIYGIALLLA